MEVFFLEGGRRAQMKVRRIDSLSGHPSQRLQSNRTCRGSVDESLGRAAEVVWGTGQEGGGTRRPKCVSAIFFGRSIHFERPACSVKRRVGRVDDTPRRSMPQLDRFPR